MKSKGFTLGTLLTLSIIMLIGCSSQTSSDSTNSTLNEAKNRGHFKVAVTSESPPFGYIDEDNNHVGFDLDIAKLINESTFGEDSEIELIDTSFDGRWEAVKNGQVDFGIMVTSIYPERLLNASFTRPYISSGNAVLVKKDSDIDSIEDLNYPDVTVAILSIPTDQDRHKNFYPEAKAQVFESTSSQISALQSGNTDVAAIDLPAAQIAAKEDESLEVLPELIGDSTNNAIFLKENDFETWLFLDSIVNEMLSGDLRSDYEEIYEKWFGESPPEQ